MVGHNLLGRKPLAIVLICTISVATSSCDKDRRVPAPEASSNQAQQPASADQTAPTANPAPASFTAEELNTLLAPIALYPDALLAQILTASTTPQEVLDGGNWLLQNSKLKGDELEQAAKKAGFGPSMMVLVHFPQVVDMMCQQMDWTTQLGQAFSSNQKAVLDAVQKLRLQATQSGALQSTPQQKVEKQQQDGNTVIVIQPADPKVVYVPQYNPEQVYTPPAQAQTTSGVSTGTAVVASLMTFGIGMAVGSALSNHNDYYYPNWGYGGVYYGPRPYYPARYAYRPVYTPYYPRATAYRPPVNYPYAYNRPSAYNGNYHYNTNYYSNFNKRPTQYGNNVNSYRGGNNNVTINNNNVNVNNSRANVQNKAANGNWKGQSTYAGANRAQTPGTAANAARSAGVGNAGAAAARTNNNTPARNRPPATMASNRSPIAPQSAGAGSGYSRANTPTAQDRGYGNRSGATAATRPAGSSGGMFAGAQHGRSENAASARGRASAGGGQRTHSRN